MLGENKNLKDSIKDTTSMPASLVSSWGVNSISYNKTNKLVTALYMVTDTMEKDEPIRLKLRTLGIEILSDINMSRGILDIGKVEQVLSFLGIAFEVRMISEMNFNILLKEFTELRQSIQDFTKQNHSWLGEFISKSPLLDEDGVGGGNYRITTSPFGHSSSEKGRDFSKGQTTRIGVQKGSTLMDALKKVDNGHAHHQEFEMLKNKRRTDIISIIKKTNKADGATITDIKTNSNGLLENCGEKTLQRELISMVKDNVLYKTGEKRWSRYFVK